MGAPEGSWEALGSNGGRTLEGERFRVRARTQGDPDELWLNVEMPDGSWSYLVLRDGAVIAHEHADSKREAYERAVEAVAGARVG